MSIYSSFFTPQTISILLCLHQSTKQVQEVDPRNPIIQFLIKKILRLNEQGSVQRTNQGFEAEMFSIINDIDFLEQYRDSVSNLDNFNSFYRQMSNILKSLRSVRTTKLQQGNVIDFLVRRLYIYFQKLDFKQIVGIYENFKCYQDSQPFKMRQHEFMLTKSIEEVKFNLQNYNTKNNSQEINKIMAQLAENDHTFKTSYIKGLFKAEQMKPNQSTHELHRYFDRSLGNLFQQKTQSTPMSNKINHCIISSAYSSLKMGHLEQCLQSISQGLRISQNNSDQQSINNCIIYLYKIAQQLGKYQQQILLAQHAITHSLNLSNIILMVYSCLCYSVFQRKYNCSNSQVTLLKSRNISWTEALHFSKKKIYSNFQSNCKNIYHSFRSLMIPMFLHKLAVLVHVPQLKSLLINPYYQRKELFELQVYQEFQGNSSPIQKQLTKAKLYFNMNHQFLLDKSLTTLANMENQAISPQDIVKIRKFFSYLKLQFGVQMNCYRSIEELVAICRKYGFVKAHMVQALNYVNKMLLKNQLYFDALVKIEETIKFCEDHSFNQEKIISRLLKAQALAQIGNLTDSLEILQKLEQQGILEKLQFENLSLFWETKLLTLKKMTSMLENEISLFNEISELKKAQINCLEHLLKCYLQQGSMIKIRKNIQQQQDFIILNPLVIDKKQLSQQRLKNILSYIDKVEQVYKKVSINSDSKEDEYDYQTVHRKVMRKIQTMFFNY